MAHECRPLSARTSEARAQEYEKPHEGIPAHLVDSLQVWLNRGLGDYYAPQFFNDFQVRSRRQVTRQRTARLTIASLFSSLDQTGELLLDMIDFAVNNRRSSQASDLKEILDAGGSA